MELFEIVMKLVGPVQPVGSTEEDAARLSNMKALTELTDRLLSEIAHAALSATRPEASMRKIGQHAIDFMRDVKDA